MQSTALTVPIKKSLFQPIKVSRQDLCRYYKVDFWGTLFRSLQTGHRLAHLLFRRRLRRSKRYYRNHKARAGRFEVLKLDDYRFVPRKRIPSQFRRIHNKERFRLYFGFTEFSLQNFFLQRRQGVARLRSSLYSSRTDFFNARPDQLLFSLGLAPTPLAARELLRKQTFLLNGEAFYSAIPPPLRVLDTLSLAGYGRRTFAQFRFGYLRLLRRKLFGLFRLRFQKLRLTRLALVRSRGVRTKFRPVYFRSQRHFRHHYQPELDLLFSRPRGLNKVTLPDLDYLMYRLLYLRARLRHFLFFASAGISVSTLPSSVIDVGEESKILEGTGVPKSFSAWPLTDRYDYFLNLLRGLGRYDLVEHFAPFRPVYNRYLELGSRGRRACRRFERYRMAPVLRKFVGQNILTGLRSAKGGLPVGSVTRLRATAGRRLRNAFTEFTDVLKTLDVEVSVVREGTSLYPLFARLLTSHTTSSEKTLTARLLLTQFSAFIARLLAVRRRLYFLQLGSVFLTTLRRHVILRRTLRGLWISWNPFFLVVLRPVQKSFFPCGRKLRRFSTIYQTKRTRRVLDKSAAAFLITHPIVTH